MDSSQSVECAFGFAIRAALCATRWRDGQELRFYVYPPRMASDEQPLCANVRSEHSLGGNRCSTMERRRR